MIYIFQHIHGIADSKKRIQRQEKEHLYNVSIEHTVIKIFDIAIHNLSYMYNWNLSIKEKDWILYVWYRTCISESWYAFAFL